MVNDKFLYTGLGEKHYYINRGFLITYNARLSLLNLNSIFDNVILIYV